MSRTVHICLLSEQPVPNICPLLDRQLRADEVVFVVSEKQRPRLAWLREVLCQYQVKIGELAIDDPYTDTATSQAVEGEIARRRANGERVLINVTGGTKPMAIGAHMAAYNSDTPVFYVHGDRAIWLYSPGASGSDPQSPIDLEERLKLPAFLLAHGVRTASAKSNRASETQLGLIDDLLRLNPAAYATGIRALNYHASKAERTLHVTFDEREANNQHLQATIDLFQRHGLLVAERHGLRFPTESDRFFCAGGWLEDHVFATVQGMAGELKPFLNDLARSLEVSYLDAQAKAPKNEIDVALLYNNTLHLIECKTKSFDRMDDKPDQALSEALYKLATLRRSLGGLRARAMLVSYQPVKDYHRERAALLDIELVASTELRELRSRIKKWLS